MFINPIVRMESTAGLAESTSLAGGTQGTSSRSFSDVFKNAVEDLRKVQEVSQNDGYQLALGNTQNLTELMINSQKAEVALDTAVQLTTRAVSAYKEIMQMQV